jgi:DNA-binding HxlR family transcriptional regulator
MTDSKHCSLATLLSQLSGQWTLYVLWVLHTNGSLRFGEIRRKVDGISTKVLTDRLRMLEAIELIHRHYEPTIPPQVSYALTDRGQELANALTPLSELAMCWYDTDGETTVF